MCDIIFTIDDDIKRRASISYYLNRHGIFAEPFEAIEEFAESLPKKGIVLIHDTKGAVPRLLQTIRARHSWLPIVAFSESPLPPQIVEAVLQGAIGYVAWPGYGEALIETLRDAGERTDAAIALGSRHALAAAQIQKLSKREREILAGMVEGLSNRMIGERLEISPRTVELHRSNLLGKVNAKHSADAIRVAIEGSLPAFDLQISKRY